MAKLQGGTTVYGNATVLGNLTVTGNLAFSGQNISYTGVSNLALPSATVIYSGSPNLFDLLPASGNIAIGTGIGGSNVVINTGGGGAQLTLTGNNARGGASYHDFLAVTSTSSGAVTPSKFFRLDGYGNIQIINSGYTAELLRVSDAGVLWVTQNIPSTSSTTGALQVVGGAGVQGNLNVGSLTIPGAAHTLVGNVTISGSGSTASGTPLTLTSTGLSLISLTSSTISGQTTYYMRQGIAGVNNGGFSLYDASNSTTRLAIDQLGNVGIGATTITANLHVQGIANEGGIKIRIENTASVGNAYSQINTAVGGVNLYNYSFANTYVNTSNTRYVPSSGLVESTGVGGVGLSASAGNIAFYTNGNNERMRIDTNGNVSIGTTSTTYKLQVNGSFAATTKSFVIDHPTKPGKQLRYGSLEGPENGVYVRGRLIDSNTIKLPDYWTKLVDPDSITVDLTPIGSYQKLYVQDISNNTVTVGNDNLLSKSVNCFYTVWAERADVEKLQVEI